MPRTRRQRLALEEAGEPLTPPQVYDPPARTRRNQPPRHHPYTDTTAETDNTDASTAPEQPTTRSSTRATRGTSTAGTAGKARGRPKGKGKESEERQEVEREPPISSQVEPPEAQPVLGPPVQEPPHTPGNVPPELPHLNLTDKAVASSSAGAASSPVVASSPRHWSKTAQRFKDILSPAAPNPPPFADVGVNTSQRVFTAGPAAPATSPFVPPQCPAPPVYNMPGGGDVQTPHTVMRILPDLPLAERLGRAGLPRELSIAFESEMLPDILAFIAKHPIAQKSALKDLNEADPVARVVSSALTKTVSLGSLKRKHAPTFPEDGNHSADLSDPRKRVESTVHRRSQVRQAFSESQAKQKEARALQEFQDKTNSRASSQAGQPERRPQDKTNSRASPPAGQPERRPTKRRRQNQEMVETPTPSEQSHTLADPEDSLVETGRRNLRNSLHENRPSDAQAPDTPLLESEIPEHDEYRIQGLFEQEQNYMQQEEPETPRAASWGISSFLPSVTSVTRFVPGLGRRTPSAAAAILPTPLFNFTGTSGQNIGTDTNTTDSITPHTATQQQIRTNMDPDNLPFVGSDSDGSTSANGTARLTAQHHVTSADEEPATANTAERPVTRRRVVTNQPSLKTAGQAQQHRKDNVRRQTLRNEKEKLKAEKEAFEAERQKLKDEVEKYREETRLKNEEERQKKEVELKEQYPNGYNVFEVTKKRRRDQAMKKVHEREQEEREYQVYQDELRQIQELRPRIHKDATPKRKRTRAPSPDIIPSLAGCSFGLDLEYFGFDDFDLISRSSKSSNQSGPYTTPPEHLAKRARSDRWFSVNTRTDSMIEELDGEDADRRGPYTKMIEDPPGATSYNTTTGAPKRAIPDSETISASSTKALEETRTHQDSFEDQTPTVQNPGWTPVDKAITGANSWQTPYSNSSAGADENTTQQYDEIYETYINTTPTKTPKSILKTSQTSPVTPNQDQSPTAKAGQSPDKTPKTPQVLPGLSSYSSSVPDPAKTPQQMVPPPRPSPQHASLPPNTPSMASDAALARARQSALKHTPLHPSRLRETSHLSTSTNSSDVAEDEQQDTAKIDGPSVIQEADPYSEYDPRNPGFVSLPSQSSTTQQASTVTQSATSAHALQTQPDIDSEFDTYRHYRELIPNRVRDAIESAWDDSGDGAVAERVFNEEFEGFQEEQRMFDSYRHYRGMIPQHVREVIESAWDDVGDGAVAERVFDEEFEHFQKQQQESSTNSDNASTNSDGASASSDNAVAAGNASSDNNGISPKVQAFIDATWAEADKEAAILNFDAGFKEWHKDPSDADQENTPTPKVQDFIDRHWNESDEEYASRAFDEDFDEWVRNQSLLT